MSFINAYDYVFPIIHYKWITSEGESGAEPINMVGSAFCIGENYYLTAGHVLEEIDMNNEDQNIGIGYSKDNGYTLVGITEHEIIKDSDLSIFKINSPKKIKNFTWHTGEIVSLDDIHTFGFPYGLDFKLKQISFRSYKGYIVSQRNFTELNSSPLIYELSFPCPRGLSGAPILRYDDNMCIEILGIVIGNSSSMINIYSDKEVIIEHGINKETIVERYEAIQYGIALHRDHILDLKSELLGKTIRDHLLDNSLIQD